MFFAGWFNLVRIVVAINLNCAVGADDGAICAAGAAGISRLSREITLAVGFLGERDYAVRAYRHTKSATLATFHIDYDFTSHLRIVCRGEHREKQNNNMRTPRQSGVYYTGIKAGCKEQPSLCLI